MKIKALIPIIVIGFVLAFTYHFVAIAAIDAPHNESNYISCGKCHGQGLLQSPFWGGSMSYDELCQYCHTASSCPVGEFGPQALTHSSENTSDKYGEWSWECRNCHDPHYQKQKNYKNTDASNLYLAWGEIQCPEPVATSCPYNSGDNTTTLQYSSITYKTGWEDVNRLTGKTWECRNTILFPNVKKLGYSYPVTAIDGSTITVKGNATPVFAYITETDFAIMYGQYIKDTIDGKPIKFFDQTGANSYADGDGTRDGVCEICHTQTAYFRNDDSGAEHPDYEEVGGAEGTNCIACHIHNVSFGHCFSGGGGAAGCHGTTGSHAAHIETIDCAICHTDPDPGDEITGYPPHVSPGTDYSFTYDDNTNTCSNVRSDAIGSCHFDTEATWGESACTGCHSYDNDTGEMGTRVDVMAQLTGNSHHIQETTVEGIHCYECHWEADGAGYITQNHNKDPYKSVDLVIYGNDSRPTDYNIGTAIEYTPDNSRAQINKINDHCISCHSDQNDTTVPFGDGKTPKEYAWDNSSIDARYSQTGTTAWGKYGEGIELTIINESFETNPGYDESWNEFGALDYLDPDSIIPGVTPPPGAGSECLQSISSASSDPLYKAFAKHNYGLELAKTVTSFYFYVEAEGLENGNSKFIGSLQDKDNNDVFRLRLNQDSGLVRFNIRIYNNGVYEDYYAVISLDTWYRVDITYDDINNTWEWKFDGITQDSGGLTGDYYSSIKKWSFGFMRSPQTYTGIIYYDLISVVGQYIGNFTSKGTQTKAYSAHGNASGNQGGWDLNETWTDTRNGSADIACFDCHNSHGSNAVGPTTSYTSATTNGGILKDTEAGKGGYSMGYEPVEGGSTEDKNAYNAGAGLCFDCHMNANEGTTPWGYQETFGATEKILGYRDTPYFGDDTSPPQQRFPYKGIMPPYLSQARGGHFGASSELTGLPGNPPPEQTTINGLCTPCHDPHGVSPTLNQEYSVPLLKGTWLTSFYPEDRAPANNVVGTLRTDRGKEGAYYIDQNTFSSDIGDTVSGIQETDAEFAGLCINCHTKASLTDGTNDGDWGSVDRIHESVKDWGANAKHNYTCSKCHAPHNARLPRLMVTNCLDKRHKGRVEDNPAPVLQGSGNGYNNWVGSPPWGCVACEGDAEELGYCPPPGDYYCSISNICGEDPGDPHYCRLQVHTGAFDGDGNGRFPGNWEGGWRDYSDTWPQYGNSVTCHEDETGSTTDQNWNTKTEWYDDTVTITSGPTAGPFTLVGGTDMQATITWTTDLDSTSIVDYGLTTSYGSNKEGGCTYNSDIDEWEHTVTLTNLPENHQTYHYRVRSAGDLGTEAVSGDNTFYISFPPSVPSLTPEPNTVCTVPCDVTLEWSASTDVDGGPIQYYAEVYEPETGTTYSFDWSEELNWTVTVTPGCWCWKVKARDKNHTEAESDWSSEDCFTTASPPSIPIPVAEPDIASTGPVTVTFEWTPSTSPLGNPVEYQVNVNNLFQSPYQSYASEWISDTHWSVTLDTGFTWYWNVRARDAVCPEAVSGTTGNDSFNIVTSNPPPVPALIDEPDIVTSVPVDITLEWEDVDDPEGDSVEYQVWVSESTLFSPREDSSWMTEAAASCDGSTCNWTVTIDTASTWYWKVQARDADNNKLSAWSALDTFRVMTSNPPPAPTLIAEPDIVSTVAVDVTLEWDQVSDPDGDPVQYYVEVTWLSSFFIVTHSSGWLSEAEAFCDGSTCNWTQSVNPTSYKTWYWRVKARDANNTDAESAWSGVDSFKFFSSNPPPAPALIDEPDIFTTVPVDVTLEWEDVDDPDGDPVQYVVQVSEWSNFGWVSHNSDWRTEAETSCDGSTCSWTFTVANGKKWYWRVQARDEDHSDAVSAWSDVDSFHTFSSNPPPTPALTDELDIETSVPVDITFEWEDVDDPDGDPVQYSVQVDDTAFFTTLDYQSGWITEGEALCDGSTCSWTETILSAKKWFWRVKARDEDHTDAESAFAAYDTFTISSGTAGPDNPSAPTLLNEPDSVSPVPIDITLEWVPVTCPDGDPVEYYVEVDDASDFSSPYFLDWTLEDVLCVLSKCSWTATGLDPDMTWHWRVQARDEVHPDKISVWSGVDSFFIHLPIIDESFEKNIGIDGTGYDDGPWTETVETGCTLDPDSAIPGITPPPDAGSECLQSISLGTGYKTFANLNYGSEEPKTFTRFYFYIEDEGLEDGNTKYIGVLKDASNTNVVQFRLNQNAGQLRFRFTILNNDVNENYYADISINTWYRIEIKYDNTSNAWEWKLSDVDGTLLHQENGSLIGTGIQRWILGFMQTTQPYTGTVYYDSLIVNTISYY